MNILETLIEQKISKTDKRPAKKEIKEEYKQKQRYFENISRTAKVEHVSGEYTDDKKFRGITYRKPKEDK